MVRAITAGRRWYLVGYDNDQVDWRSFRVERITEPVPAGQWFTAWLPTGVDPAEFAMNKLYSTAPVFRAVVTVHKAGCASAGVARRLGTCRASVSRAAGCPLRPALWSGWPPG
jgi:hypothetical protein